MLFILHLYAFSWFLLLNVFLKDFLVCLFVTNYPQTIPSHDTIIQIWISAGSLLVLSESACHHPLWRENFLFYPRVFRSFLQLLRILGLKVPKSSPIGIAFCILSPYFNIPLGFLRMQSTANVKADSTYT